MDTNKCMALPDDLLVDIFRCLDATAVIRCAAVCRPWRRAIIGNASCLRPRPDRFLPALLLGFLDKHPRYRKRPLQYVPVPSNTFDVPRPFTSPTIVGVRVDGRLYNNLLSSRDGFLLLGESKSSSHHSTLCLCTALTRARMVLPSPAPPSDPVSWSWMYVLATVYDMEVEDHSGDDEPAPVWILAVKWSVGNCKDGITYRIFSSASGGWGPVRCSAKFPEDVANVSIEPRSSSSGDVVVCHGAVSWFVYLYHKDKDAVERSIRKCMFSVDLRTGRTWTTELPEFGDAMQTLSLAMSGEEEHRQQLCLARMLLSPTPNRMELWVLVGDDGRWTLRRTIDDVHELFTADCPTVSHMLLSGFCPRSGYLFGFASDKDDPDLHHHFVIGVDGSSPRMIGSFQYRDSGTRFPYEMDCSTYVSLCISKMKCF